MKMKKKIWIHRAGSFKEAADFDLEYYLSMSPAERLDTVQYLREIHCKIGKGRRHARRKGL